MNNMNTDNKKMAHFILAQKRVEQIRDFYTHLITYCTVNLLFLAFWFFLETSMPETFWRPAFIMMAGIAGLAVLAHGLYVFGAKYILPKSWEEKKLKELINKQNQHNKYQ